MLQTIHLYNVIPNVFEGVLPDGIPSDVWLESLTFRRGESYLIDAASGRGKSSLCAYLYGLRHDYRGTIDWLDEHGERLLLSNENVRTRLWQQGMAMLFQEMRLFPELTATENVMLKANLTNWATRSQVRDALSRLGLSERLDTPCRLLSIGQQQRVALLRTISQPADFCLLDEPVSHLDAQNAQVMSDLLSEWQQRTGAALLVTSVGNHLPFDYQHILHL